MGANQNALKSKMSCMADAIRNQSGESGAITIGEMPGLIHGMSVGNPTVNSSLPGADMRMLVSRHAKYNITITFDKPFDDGEKLAVLSILASTNNFTTTIPYAMFVFKNGQIAEQSKANYYANYANVQWSCSVTNTAMTIYADASSSGSGDLGYTVRFAIYYTVCNA